MTPGWIINAVLTLVIIFISILPCQPHSKKLATAGAADYRKRERYPGYDTRNAANRIIYQ